MEYLPIYALDDTIIIPILQTLIDHGADVNIDTGTEYSPLAMAILKHRYEVFQFLLDKGAKINTFIEEDESMSYETKIALYNKYSRLYILELICRGVTIPNDKCLYLLPKFSNYSEENKGNIYKLLTKHGIKTHSDIDRLQLTSEIKEHLKNVLFPLENTQKSN
jgi:ankyrin repeat protein